MYTNNNQFSATYAMQNYILTTSQRLKTDAEYQKVMLLVKRLIEAGVTVAGKGYCISMSDIVYSLLKQNNIPCKIVECHLLITNKTTQAFYAIGYDGLKETNSENKSDTHVIVVTETNIPMLIDLSISHLLPNNVQGIVDEVSEADHGGVFASIDHNLMALTYQRKKEYSIPMLHQRSIVDRIQTDVNIFKNLKMLKIFIGIALTVSILNASRGFYDFYSVYILDNYWGPRAVKYLTDKVESIESKIEQLNK